jgi:hypothetical protein
MDAGSIAIGACGGALLLLTLADLLATVFAYDGFTLWTPHFQGLLWRGGRAVTAAMPRAGRDGILSLLSASLVPLTMVMWLALETASFAMVYIPGLRSGAFTISHGAYTGVDAAFYFAGGDLTSLTFGDFVPRSDFYRAMVDVETMIGLATFTLGLTYVLTAFGAMEKLSDLHSRVRRNAMEPNRPETILHRVYHYGDQDRLASFLQATTDELDAYDEALRRFPVAFYFHTRRLERSTPRIFSALGELIELVRWGMPADDPVTRDPALLALVDTYCVTIDRLKRSFVGPAHIDTAPPPPGVSAEFAAMQAKARTATGLRPASEIDSEQLTQWSEFHAHRLAVIDRVSDALGYR